MSFLAAALASVGSAMVAAATARLINNLRRLLHVESTRIESAALVLKKHRALLDEFLERPSVDDDLRRFALEISAATLDRAFAISMMKVLEDGMKHTQADCDSPIDASLERLFVEDPNAVSLFTRAMQTGVVAMLLQWPETGQAMTASILQIVDETDVTAKAKSAVTRIQRARHHHPGDHAFA